MDKYHFCEDYHLEEIMKLHYLVPPFQDRILSAKIVLILTCTQGWGMRDVNKRKGKNVYSTEISFARFFLRH